MIGGNLADPVQPSAEGGLRGLLRGAITRRLGGLRVVGPGDALADVIPVECARVYVLCYPKNIVKMTISTAML